MTNQLTTKFRFTALVLALFASIATAWAYDFYYTCSNGQRLYFTITNSSQRYVSVVAPGGNNSYGWDDYTKPTGNLVIPDLVISNNIYYVTSIGEYAFYNCSGLTSVYIPNSVTSIGRCAFDGCTDLTSVTIPNSITSIGSYAFDGCTDLTSVTIPNSITSLGNGTFYNCSGLSTIYTYATTPPTLGSNCFYGVPSTVMVVVPCGTSQVYANWGGFNNIIETCPGEITVIANPAGGGTVSGGGSFEGGQNCTVTATANEGFVFLYWSENGAIVSTDASYSFIVGGDRNLVANFASENPDPITFSDANVKAVCLANWDTNGDGELSYAEAAAVTSVGTQFKNNTSITSFNELQYFIRLVTIDAQAFFGCTALTQITIPEPVTSVGSKAFWNCPSLQTVYFNANNCTSMQTTYNTNIYSVFSSNATGAASALTRVVVGSNVTRIPDYAFKGSEDIYQRLVIPSSVTEIGNHAFYKCNSMVQMVIQGNGLQTIGEYAFYDCSALANALNLPNSVTTVGQYAFYGCSVLPSATFGTGVTSIGGYAFWNCPNLATVNFNPTNCTMMVTNSQYSVFNSGTSNDGATPIVTLNIGSNVTTIPDYAFRNSTNLTSNISIPNATTSIGTYAFYGAKSITLTIGTGVTSIGGYAFWNCPNLTTVNFNATNCTSMDSDAVFFIGQYQLHRSVFNVGSSNDGPTPITTLNIGSNVTRIPDYAFNNSTGLTGNIVIPDATTYVGEASFFGVQSHEVTIGEGATTICRYAFWNCPNLSTVHFNANNCASMYTNHPYISNSSVVYEYLSVFNVGTSISGATPIVTLNIGSNVTKIPNYAFRNSTNLTSNIIIPNATTSIGTYAFYGAKSTTLTIGTGVTSIGGYAFWNCPNLATVNFNPTNCTTMVTNSQYSVFNSGTSNNDATPIVTLSIGSNVTKIPSYAFRNSANITGSLTLPNVLNTIGQYAFYGCDHFTGSLTIPNSVTTLGQYAFYSCSGFNGNLTLPSNSSLIEINQYTFYGCSGLNGTMTIPTNIKTIGSSAFRGCSGFTGALILHNAMTTISDYAFYGCTHISSLTIGTSIMTIGGYAFWNCPNLATVNYNATDCTSMVTNSLYSVFNSGTSNGGTTPIVTLNIGSNVTKIPDYAFRNSSNQVNNLVIPGNVTSIGKYAFAGSSGASRTLLLGDALTSIDEYAFQGCSGFTGDLVIPNSVTTLGQYAFQGCSGFNGSLIIGSGVTTINQYVFADCSGFAGSLIVGRQVNSIGNYAFKNCSAFSYVISENPTPPTAVNNSFQSMNFSIPLYVPYAMMPAYQSAAGWSQFTNRVEQCVFDQLDNDLWSDVNNWYAFALPGANDVVCVNSNCHMDVNANVLHLYVLNLNDVLTINSGKSLSTTYGVGTLQASQLVVADGGSLYNPISNAYGTVKKQISGYGTGDGGWYTIASPIYGGTSVSGLTTGTYDLYVYDEAEAYWDNQKVSSNNITSLNSAQGYLYANSAAKTLSMAGQLNASNADFSIAVTHQNGTLPGFNLVGNPYTNNISIGSVKLNNTPFTTYYKVANGNQLIASTSANPIKPAEGFMVQVSTSGTLIFNATGREGQGRYVQLTLRQGEQLTDRAYLSMEGGESLNKAVMAGHPSLLYLVSEGQPLAVAPYRAQAYNLVLDAVENGDFTIEAEQLGTDCNYLHLLDRLTGEDFDLLSSSYTFEAAPTDRTDRFVLLLAEGEQPELFDIIRTRDMIPVLPPHGSGNDEPAYPQTSYDITVTADPAIGGTVSGAGPYLEGASCTLTATANPGYTFTNWTKNGTQVSTNATYTFTVTENADFVAHFSANTYEITATASPEAGGTVTGAGTYTHGETVTLTATANEHYEFSHWTNGSALQYFTIESFEDNNTITLTIGSAVTQEHMQSVSYSTDNGATWNTTTIDDTEQVISVSLNAGEKMLWKGTGVCLASNYSDNTQCSIFNGTKAHGVSGNIASLLFGDDFAGQTELPITPNDGRNYQKLFYQDVNLVEAHHLVLPFMVLQDNCYNRMFYGCSSLATTPALSATVLTNFCYRFMFAGCSSLTSAPVLPATTLATYCYENMFNGCTSLAVAPELPATTLKERCYSQMFDGCTSLSQAPVLPATTLEDRCYYYMFRNCSLVNEVTCLATDISAPSCTLNWLNNVASTGTFHNAVGMEAWSAGASGIPTGWTVAPATDYTNQYFTIESLEDGNTITLTIGSAVTSAQLSSISYSTDNGVTWNTTTVDNTTQAISVTLNNGQKAMWKGLGLCMASGYNNETQWSIFTGTKQHIVYGNIASLLFGDDFTGQFVLPAGTNNGRNYQSLFRGNAYLVSAENLVIPFTTLQNNCYASMFQSCTSLTVGPELPAMSMTQYCYSSMFRYCGSLISAPVLPSLTMSYACYSSMFQGCTSLPQSPELPAPTLVSTCYQAMFSGCSSLSEVTCLATNVSATNCTANWLNGVASTGTFHKATGSVNWNSGSSGIPSGWNVEGVSPFDPTQPSVSFTVVESADYIAYFNIEQFEILASANPEDYGTVTGGGYYPYGSTCTLTADALEGYHFDGWTKDGAVVATSRVYAFTVEEAGSYVANFSVATYEITTSASPEEGGTVTGSGTYTHGETVTLTATPNPGYEFDHWGPGYEFQYFTIESLEDGNTITLTIGSAVTQAQMQNISYSTDNGITWNTTTIDNTEQVINVSLNAGEKVLWKGLGTNMASGYQEASQWSVFNSTKQHVVYGNIASLLFGDDFEGQMSLSKGRTYQRLFSNDSNLVAAEHLILPFTNLQVECYGDLFNGCSSLVSAPKLPAVTIKSYCYQSMFNGCSSLLVAPDLPATTLQSYCYNNMFKGCASLTAAPELPATTLANYCYTNMFNGCTSLLSAPTLPATTLANYCYHQMFQGCSSLQIAPALPATSLAERCYWAMFYGCSLLEQAPELPAVTLTDYCYDMMFKYCSSLANAPVLPAQTLTQYCYYQMFWGCSLINEITCLATDISATGATEGWLYNVASSGTFHEAPEMTGWATGTSGIPANWTVEDNTTNYQTPFEEQYFTIESLEDGNTITLTIPAVITTDYMTSVSYSTDNGTTWNITDIDGTAKTITVSLANSGDKVLFKGLGRTLTYGNSHDNEQSYFSASKQYIVYGNIASMLYGDDFEDKTQFPNNSARTYQGLFRFSTTLVSAQHLVMPFSAVAGHCFRDMFQGCTALTQAPALPATTLNSDCYMNMFNSCTALTQAPELPATTLASECYNQMFRGCSSLTHAPELPAQTLAYMCYYLMFHSCSSLAQAPNLPAATLVNKCYQSMFYGCSSLSEVTCLATDISATDCTASWMNGVASTGIFHKASGMNDWPTGVSGIPSGWMVEDPEQEPAINLNEPTISFEVTESGLYVAYFNPIIAMQTFELVQGWNWWAPMVKVTAVQLQDSIGNSLVQIKTEEGIVGENIEPGEMYRIQTSAPCEVSLAGLSITPVEVSLAPGANWFGSICVEEKPIAAAISVEATAGDKIVSQNGGFAIYNGTVWEGTLTTLQPGCGYVYVTTESKTLIVDAVGINEPTVTTSQVTNVTQTTATCGGNVTDDGGGQVTERGICWGTSQTPTISGSHVSSGTGTGSYTVNMTGLTANTTYYVRAYATNSAGTAYGSEVSFTTSQIVTVPTVTTSQVTNVTQTTATCGGNVTATGNATVTERGICWGTSQNPTTSGSHVSSGTGTGSYTVNMTGLTANTTYYVRAYATNSAGTAYGSEVSFTTSQIVTVPTVTTSQVTNVTQTTATCGGNVTATGNATVTARGVCWSTSQNPTVTGSHTTNGTGTGSFTSSITGLSPNTTYYVRAYATNSAGTAYGTQRSFTTTQNITQLTVFDGTVTDERVPVVGWVLNHYTKCEYVMPASYLSSMNGKTITSMACYSTSTSVDYAATFRVFIKEVSSSTISSFQGYSDATTVYEGSLTVTNGILTIEFTTPFTYNGGNLLLGFYNISPGTGHLYSKRFYGVTATDSSVVGWNQNSLNDITSPGEFPNFLPKTTFYFSN